MKPRILTSGLITGAALLLLGGCASDYDQSAYGYGDGYYGGYYGDGYYDGYYGPSYYGGAFIPFGGFHRDRDHDRGGHRDFSRMPQNAQSARIGPAQHPSGGFHGGRGGGTSGNHSGGRSGGGPHGAFGHPGTAANPL